MLPTGIDGEIEAAERSRSFFVIQSVNILITDGQSIEQKNPLAAQRTIYTAVFPPEAIMSILQSPDPIRPAGIMIFGESFIATKPLISCPEP